MKSMGKGEKGCISTHFISMCLCFDTRTCVIMTFNFEHGLLREALPCGQSLHSPFF